MRTIVLSLLVGAVVLWAAAPATPLSTIADLATDFSTNDGSSAISKFDSSLPGYSALANNIQAITDQAEVVCAIEIVSDAEAGGVHKLDLDWIMNLKSTGDNVTTERRRERVNIEMRQVRGKWKITAISPVSILEPLHII